MTLPGEFLWFANPWQGRTENVSKKPLNRQRNQRPRSEKNSYVFSAIWREKKMALPLNPALL
jgi:hypothetical protein